MDRTRWWLAGVAAILAAVIVIESIGFKAGVITGAVSLAALFGWRHWRTRHPAKPPGVYCLKCGEQLAPTARRCDSCGSASWTTRW